MALIATLRDDFADNLQANAWSSSYVNGSATKAESSGRAVFTLPSSTAGAHDAAYRSADSYDLTGDGCFINIATMVATGVAAQAYFRLQRDTDSYLEWSQLSNTIRARYILGGVGTDLHTATWNATTYKYLRCRESGGTITFESSSNGTSWTSRGTVTVATFGAVTDLRVWFGANCGNIASPGTFQVEEFNTLSLATTWRWVEARREYQHRIGSVSLAATAGVGYLAIAASIDASGNLVSPRYFAGPQGSGEELTEQSSQAAAQAMAVNLPLDGRWYLPKGVFVEGRYVRLYLRSSTGSSYTLREFYPRRYIQADDIEAESIRTRLLAAGAVTADKISVLQLSAITADMGTLTAGTIIGGVIKTATSGARIEQDSANGLRSYNSSSVLQVQIRTSDGKLTWAGGVGTLDSDGMAIDVTGSSTPTADRALRFIRSGATGAGLYGYQNAGGGANLAAQATSLTAGTDAVADIESVVPSTTAVRVRVGNILLNRSVQITGAGLRVGTGSGTVAEGDVDIDGGLSIGAGTGAAAGEFRALANTTGATSHIVGNTNSGASAFAVLRMQNNNDLAAGLLRNSSGNTAYAGANSLNLWTGSAHGISICTNDTMRIAVSGAGAIGFFGSSGTTKPTVSGSRGGNAALASLLTALAGLGLVTDSSS